MCFQPIKLSIFGLHATSRLYIWNLSSNKPVVKLLWCNLVGHPLPDSWGFKGLKKENL